MQAGPTSPLSGVYVTSVRDLLPMGHRTSAGVAAEVAAWKERGRRRGKGIEIETEIENGLGIENGI